ncbi:MAG: hypothetical protein U9P38_04775 [Campylobacterota bacterium]|nr:hypothetical protein [Campylobacterota bacterium]
MSVLTAKERMQLDDVFLSIDTKDGIFHLLTIFIKKKWKKIYEFFIGIFFKNHK